MKPLDRKWVWFWSALLLVGLLVLPFLVKNYRVFQFNLVLVYAIAILGLNILTGFNGQISLGHGWRATIWRSPHSRWRWRCRNC